MGKRAGKVKDDRAVRSVTLPVGTVVSHTWEELGPALNACFRASTDAANWCVQQLYKRDAVGQAKTPDAVKMGRSDKGRFYAYGEAGRCGFFKGWAGGKQSLNIVLQYAHREYLRRRFDVVVRGIQSLLTVRHPYPYPLDADAYSLSFRTEQEVTREVKRKAGKKAVAETVTSREWVPSDNPAAYPCVEFRLPGLDRPVVLRLKRGAEFGRQLAALRQIHAGTAGRGEAALYRNSKGDLLVKVVGKMPRRERGPAVNVCFLHTDPGAMLVAEINGRKVTVTNGDHVRRWGAANLAQERTYERRLAAGESAPAIPPHRGGGPIPCDRLEQMQACHKSYLERARQDKKREVRMSRRQRANLNKSVRLRCDKHRFRVETAVKQVAAQVARMCQRQGVGLIAYDDTVRSFLPSGFPWHALKTRLQQVCVGEMGGEWIDGQFAHLKDSEEREEWLLRQQTAARFRAARRVAAHQSRPRGKSHPAVSTAPATSSSSAGRSSTTCSRATRRPRS